MFHKNCKVAGLLKTCKSFSSRAFGLCDSYLWRAVRYRQLEKFEFELKLVILVIAALSVYVSNMLY